jgi:hypothetical protein
MQYKNWKLSDGKWNPETGVLSELNKPGRIDWERVKELLGQFCGHCVEYGCNECSLSDISLCGYYPPRGVRLDGCRKLSHMACRTSPRNKRKARRIANRIYNQILKDKPEE